MTGSLVKKRTAKIVVTDSEAAQCAYMSTVGSTEAICSRRATALCGFTALALLTL